MYDFRNTHRRPDFTERKDSVQIRNEHEKDDAITSLLADFLHNQKAERKWKSTFFAQRMLHFALSYA